jgi:hypothetical protein
MEQVNIDRWLAIGGLAVGIIGIIIAIAVPLYFYRKGLRPKLFSVAYNGAFALMMSTPGVTVSYLGSPRTALSRTNILFWNRGTSPIEDSDFIAPIAFPDTEIIAIEILCKDPMAIASVEGHTLKISLLRPSEAIVVKVEQESFYRPNLVMPTKTANMVETLSRVPGILGNVPTILMIVFGLCSFIGTVILLHHFGADPPNQTLLPVVSTVCCLLFAVAGNVVGSQLLKRMTPDIPYRFLTATVWQDVSEKVEMKDKKLT